MEISEILSKYFQETPTNTVYVNVFDSPLGTYCTSGYLWSVAKKYNHGEISEIISKYFQETPNNTVYVNVFDSPLGKICAAADENYLYLVSFEDSKNLERKILTIVNNLQCNFITKPNKVLVNVERELKDYFEGKLKKFTIPIKTFGSDFQKEVWSSLQEIPYASTKTYADLAKMTGRSASHARAIGAACGANTHFLVVPCHRVIASGSNGGFSSGINRKVWLLNHEAKYK